MAEKNYIDNPQERLEESRFQEQCFLMEHYDAFMTKNQDTKYKNFAIVNTTNSVSLLLNKMLGKGIAPLMEIKPFELSLLQPRIRIFKVFYDGEKEKSVELRFDEFINENRFRDVSDLTKNNFQLGGGAGLKNFEWEDLGTNPGDTDKSFKATLEMHFQNSKDLFVNRARAEEPITSFADLIRHSPKRFTSTISGKIQNEKHFRIKVEVGWQLPPKNIIIANNSPLYKAIKNSVVTMFLTLTSHRLKYNQNGTLDVVAEYIGAIEGKLISPDSDVLYVRKGIEEQIQNIDFKIKLNKKATEIAQETVNKSGKTFFGNSDDEIILEEAQKRLESFEIEKDKLLKENKIKSYRTLLTTLEENGKLYYIDIPKEEIELMKRNKKDERQYTKEESDKFRNSRNKNFRQRVKPGNIEPNSWKNIGVKSRFGRETFSDSISKFISAKNEEEINNINKSHTKANSAKRSGDKRINFFYLGDLVNAALEVIFRSNNNSKAEKNSNNDFRFILGPIEIQKKDGSKDIRNLADIPISLNLFQAWFLKNVIRESKEKYLLRDFLKDLFSQLILKALGPECSEDNTGSVVSNRVSFSVFSIPTIDNEEIIPNNSRISSERFAEKLNAAKSRVYSKNVRHYLMMYVSNHKPDKLEGNFEKDFPLGVYHFNIGSDRGLLKNVEFEKANIQYLPESRIYDSEEVQKGDAFLSEPYNANMSMWGNTIFKPGMVLYINPKSLGISKNEILPIGGYYNVIRVFNKIASGVFETNLELVWQNSGVDKEVSKSPTKKLEPATEDNLIDKVHEGRVY